MKNKKYIRWLIEAIISCYLSYKVAIKFKKHYEILDNGRRIILYALPKPGTRVKSIFNLAQDVQTALYLPSFMPFWDGKFICIAILESQLENKLSTILQSDLFRRSRMQIPLAIGYDLRGEIHIADLSKWTHLLIGGATNSGKTVFLQCVILSVVLKQAVNKVNLIIIDTGAGDLDLFDAIPHLVCSIVKDCESAVRVILKLFDEMERRNQLSADDLQRLPTIVCVVDEYLSLISNISGNAKDELISSISNLLSRARHANIYLILATQETAKNDMLISGANLTTRIAFRCADFYASRSILGEGGAENLPGSGALLFKSAEHSKPVQLQGAYMSTEEIKKLIDHTRSQSHDSSNKFVIDLAQTSASTLALPCSTSEGKQAELDHSKEEELAKIVLWTLGRNGVSSRQIQKKFHTGNRAKVFLEKLFTMGLIADKHGNLARAVLPQCIKDISAEVIEFLRAHGTSADEIEAAFECRHGDNA